MEYLSATASGLAYTLSRDGNSAWASVVLTPGFMCDLPTHEAVWRASDVLVRTPQGWRIAAMAWTEPVPDAELQREAQSGARKAAPLAGDPGDAGLRDAFAKLASDGVDAGAATRADLVVIGSAPGERTVGGAVFARGWNAAWKGKLAIVSSIARVLPSGTTGWVAATAELAAQGGKLPVTVFAVFDKTGDGRWSLVHVHFAA